MTSQISRYPISICHLSHHQNRSRFQDRAVGTMSGSLAMSESGLQDTSMPENSGTKIFSFGCRIPIDGTQHYSDTSMREEIMDLENPLQIQSKTNHTALPHPQSDIGLKDNVGVVGTVTLLGRSTAMVWVGWGRLQDYRHSQDDLGIVANQSLGSGTLS